MAWSRDMSTTSSPYHGFRFTVETINQAVWLYHCFSLSLREVGLILTARGIEVSYETIRDKPKPSSNTG
jgi:putative transposase